MSIVLQLHSDCLTCYRRPILVKGKVAFFGKWPGLVTGPACSHPVGGGFETNAGLVSRSVGCPSLPPSSGAAVI